MPQETNIKEPGIARPQEGEIVVLGAGESGNGAAILAKAKGYKVFVSDSGKIQERYRKELQDEGIDYEEGGHDLQRILGAGLIIKSPGIPEKAAVMKAVRTQGTEVISEIEWGYRFKGASKIIGITGSNGKSTTTSLTYHLLKDGGKEASITGNIGISFARQVALSPTEWYVIEISSFQLDDIKTFRPDIGIILNITPDHLDRYGYQFENYVASKFRIAENQTKDDYLILNKDDTTITGYLKDHTLQPKILSITMNENNLPPNEDGASATDGKLSIRLEGDEWDMSINELALKGKHNQYNSMAAGISARTAGIRKQYLRESFGSFNGLEHRLEYVATVRGVEFINDSKATNVNSVWYALESMTKPVILILGGQDTKGNDYREIMELIHEKVKAIVCMGLDNTLIHNAFENEVREMIDTQSAREAVQAAYALADRGDVVLLSPACSSFDLFNDFEDRGRQFKAAVREL